MGKDQAIWNKLILCVILVLFLWGQTRMAGLGFASEETPQESQPEELPFWGEIYGATVATDAEDGNATSDPFVRLGVSIFELGGRPVDIYIKGRFYHDTQANFWNNKWQLGPGLRWFPFKNHGLVLFMECLYNKHTGRERANAAPPDRSGRFYVEGGAAYWGWFGPAPWSAADPEFYMPFTGWREVYADALYYERDNDNFIGTVDHKEGVFLGKIRDTTIDAYVTVEAGLDANGDPWNHFIKGGPGVRIAPFPNLDLKVSAEYFMGRYTKGGYGDTSRNISDFKVTASFWIGW